MASKSSVNAILVNAFTGSRLVKVYSNITGSPGTTGSFVKDFVKLIKSSLTTR